MRTESPCTATHQLDASKILPHEEPQKNDVKSSERQQQNTLSADDIRAACINKSLVPALSMDVWLAFDLRNLA